MEIKIHTQGLDLSEAQNEVIEKKITHLAELGGRLKDEATEVRVEFAYQEVKAKEDAYLCQVTFYPPHATIRAEARGEKVEDALDEVIDKIRPQIERYKDKEYHLSERHE